MAKVYIHYESNVDGSDDDFTWVVPSVNPDLTVSQALTSFSEAYNRSNRKKVEVNKLVRGDEVLAPSTILASVVKNGDDIYAEFREEKPVKVYLHFEDEPDMTWVMSISPPLNSTTTLSVATRFCEVYNDKMKAHDKFRPLDPERVDVMYDDKSLPLTGCLCDIVVDGSDVFIERGRMTSYVKNRTHITESDLDEAEPVSQQNTSGGIPSEEEQLEDMIKRFMENKNYASARERCTRLLELKKTNTVALNALIEMSEYIEDWDSLVTYLDRQFRAKSDDLSLLLRLGDAHFKSGDLSDALSVYQRGLTICKQKASIDFDHLLFEFSIGLTMLESGKVDTAEQIIVSRLKQDESHLFGLFCYAKLLRHRNMQHQEQLKVILRLIVHEQDNKKYRDHIAYLLARPDGLTYLTSLLPPSPSTTSVYAFLGDVMKDVSFVDEAVQLYKHGLDASEQRSVACGLSLSHTLQLQGHTPPVVESLLHFFSANPLASVGGVTAGEVSAILETVTLSHQPKGSVCVKVPFLSDYYQSPPVPVLSEKVTFSEQELALLAMYMTALKVLYIAGEFSACCKLVDLISKAKQCQLHFTKIRNENAYYECIRALLPTLPTEPADGALPVLYVVGDSHCVTLAWRRVMYKGQMHVINSLLVTGMKIWHLREESKFYPKYNFHKALKQIPDGADVVFLIGEIDCREGLTKAVETGRFPSMHLAMQNTIRIYTRTLLELTKSRNFEISIHPVPPVLDVTRSLVMHFNDTLAMFASMKRPLRWLKFHQDMVTQDPSQQGMGSYILKPGFDLDGTHLSPIYLDLFEKSLP